MQRIRRLFPRLVVTVLVGLQVNPIGPEAPMADPPGARKRKVFIAPFQHTGALPAPKVVGVPPPPVAAYQFTPEETARLDRFFAERDGICWRHKTWWL